VQLLRVIRPSPCRSCIFCSEVTGALGPAAQLRLLSVARCGLAALQHSVREFAAHPYLRIQTYAAAHVAQDVAIDNGSDDDA
jgi:hypothetical protein